MNPFLGAAALLMAGGAGWAWWQGRWEMGVVYLCYAVANALLGRMG